MELSILILISLLILVIGLYTANKVKIKRLHQQHQEEKKKLLGEIDILSVYKGIRDIDNEINGKRLSLDRMIADAEEAAKFIEFSAIKEADRIVKEANQEVEATKGLIKGNRNKAKTILDEAQEQSSVIVEIANERAKEIAGEAYEAKQNADLYEETVKAMKNLIKGYGNEYLKPTHDLLDNLAEEFGHKEAGQALKKCRERTKLMIKNIESAATCDYVEKNRKETAINFVLDAFIGKVDSILTRVKHDNFGKLEQEIKDAYTLVNFNGKAFRNARISKEFLNQRLEELTLAVQVHMLKLEEREEQRQIKEAIREEERARREFEKAIKAAEKEEKLLQDAMKRAQEQLAAASQEEREKYQAELYSLKQLLQEAEERNQRAISMAQQTKRGHVYVISNIGSFGEDIFKIGLTRRLEPMDRVKELGDASVPFQFDVHAMIYDEDAPKLEAMLHQEFKKEQLNKVNSRKEFFKVPISQIRKKIKTLGIEAKWTLAAEAKEYYESLSIEKREQLELQKMNLN
ncbi:MAG: DUF4041 domain-containing protein [Marinilabiliaceae bacterium]|nr:DUF4041 domain-containing protein [Marinilabiliaceae bacterium]